MGLGQQTPAAAAAVISRIAGMTLVGRAANLSITACGFGRVVSAAACEQSLYQRSGGYVHIPEVSGAEHVVGDGPQLRYGTVGITEFCGLSRAVYVEHRDDR